MWIQKIYWFCFVTSFSSSVALHKGFLQYLGASGLATLRALSNELKMSECFLPRCQTSVHCSITRITTANSTSNRSIDDAICWPSGGEMGQQPCLKQWLMSASCEADWRWMLSERGLANPLWLKWNLLASASTLTNTSECLHLGPIGFQTKLPYTSWSR